MVDMSKTEVDISKVQIGDKLLCLAPKNGKIEEVEYIVTKIDYLDMYGIRLDMNKEVEIMGASVIEHRGAGIQHLVNELYETREKLSKQSDECERLRRELEKYIKRTKILMDGFDKIIEGDGLPVTIAIEHVAEAMKVRAST